MNENWKNFLKKSAENDIFMLLIIDDLLHDSFNSESFIVQQ